MDMADFNGDQLADFIVGSWYATSVSLSDGPQMGSPAEYAAENAHLGLATGYLDDDGFVDAIVSNCSGNAVHVYFGSSSGGLDYAGQFPVGGFPTAVHIRDLDNDGWGDVVSANENGVSISVAFGTPYRSFGARVDYPVNAIPSAVTSGDFDRDGWIDLLVVNRSVSLLRGRRGGQSFHAPSQVINQPDAYSISIADCNGDSLLDCAIGGATSARMYLGDGLGGFALATTFSGVSNVTALALVDLDQDGRMDLAGVSSGTNSIFVLEGLGSGTYGPRLGYAAGDGAWGLGIGDTNGDGLLDIAVANHWESTITHWLGVPDVSAAPDLARPLGRLLRAGPSPFRGTTNVEYVVEQPGHACLAIYDVHGRQVRILESGVLAPGTFFRSWDGRDDAGQETGSGLYFLRFAAGETRETTKLVRTR